MSLAYKPNLTLDVETTRDRLKFQICKTFIVDGDIKMKDRYIATDVSRSLILMPCAPVAAHSVRAFPFTSRSSASSRALRVAVSVTCSVSLAISAAD